MKRSFKVLAAALIAVLLSSCVSSTKVTIDCNAKGADVYVNGEYKGQAPVAVKVSNLVFKDHSVRFERDGRVLGSYTMEDEGKVVNIVFGTTIWWWSLLWCVGPQKYQYFTIHEDNL